MTRSPTTGEVLLCVFAVIAVGAVAAFMASEQALWLKTGRKQANAPPPTRTYVLLRPEPVQRPSAQPQPLASRPASAQVQQKVTAPQVVVPKPATNPSVPLPKPKLLLPAVDDGPRSLPVVDRAAPPKTPVPENGRPGGPSLPSKSVGSARPRYGIGAGTPGAPSEVLSPLYADARREVGRGLLGFDGKQGGTIPPITMDYQRTLGWNNYVQAMQRLGGQFFIFDRRTDRVRGLADLRKVDVTPTNDEALRGLSPRLREIQQEDAIVPLMARAQSRFGAGDYALVLLLPLNVDFDIVGGIARSLAERNIDIKSVARVAGEYEESSTGLRLHVRQLIRRNGSDAPVNFTIDLQ